MTRSWPGYQEHKFNSSTLLRDRERERGRERLY